MKNIFIFLVLAIVLISCGKDDKPSDNRDCREVEYNTDITFQLSDKVCFPDENSITITNIEHGFCPCGIDCDWEGGLYITLSASTSTGIVDKKFYENSFKNDPEIFENHNIASFSYIYGTEDEEVPGCAADFVPEKITLTLTISKT